jgi:hypothetical protein
MLNNKKQTVMTKTVNIRFFTSDAYIGRAGKGQNGYLGNPFPLKTAPEFKRRGRKLEEVYASD